MSDRRNSITENRAAETAKVTPVSVDLQPVPSPLREKLAEGRMRGQRCTNDPTFPLTLALSLMERGLIEAKAEDQH